LLRRTADRFTAGQGYLYDEAGNVTQDATNQRFVYDAENHQTQFFNSTNTSQRPTQRINTTAKVNGWEKSLDKSRRYSFIMAVKH
jgi:hypothetical protein